MDEENKVQFRISAQSFELHYDPESKLLILHGVEAMSGRKLVAVFEPQATRALCDLLEHTQKYLGVRLGADEIEPPALQ